MSVPKVTVRLTSRAERDFRQILLYTRRIWGERQRTTYRQEIGQALRQLRDHPEIGQSEDELFIGCRGLRVEQHILYSYQPHPAEIVVLRILHVHQDPIGKVNG